MEERIMEFLIASTTLRPISFDEGKTKDNWPCITFHFFNDTGAVFGAGMAQTETAYCQVDFWYKARTEMVKNSITDIKNAITQERTFTHPEKEYNFETDMKMHHTYFTFQLIKKEGE